MKNKILIILFLILIIYNSCKNELSTKDYKRQIIIHHNNSSVSLKSIDAIKIISSQKIQELYDLGLLYVYNNKDKELDSIIYNHIDNYFIKQDSSKINLLLNEIKKSKSNIIKVKQNKIFLKKSILNDSIFYAKFLVKFYNKKKYYIHSKNKYVEYMIKKDSNKKFKFYFLNFLNIDSIR